MYPIRERFKKILTVLKKEGIDGLLLNSEPNVSFACGFHAPDSYAIVAPGGLTLITDFRYIADFQKKASRFVHVREYKKTVFHTIVAASKSLAVKNLGFESKHLSFAECETIHRLASKSIKFIPLKETLEPIRAIKDTAELANIKKAIAITLAAFSFLKKILKPGLSELGVAAEIERFIRIEGAQGPAFDIIVASGPNSSYPHAQISGRILKDNEPVIVDMGVTFNGYKSDLTRTFFLGKINASVRKAELIVRQAQRRAIEAIKPGLKISKLDALARNYIAQKGFGKNFGHALGHGVGLEVHESPSINKKNKGRLKTGQIFTIEPGIYLAGQFGIRIEDMVLVTESGAENLSGNDRY
jgi:Xaa-Pro aminopeptidase